MNRGRGYPPKYDDIIFKKEQITVKTSVAQAIYRRCKQLDIFCRLKKSRYTGKHDVIFKK